MSDTPKPKPPKATKAQVARRVEEILQVKLQGAMFHDLLRFIADKEQASEEPWAIPDGGKPLAERTIWWYSQKADQLLFQTFRNERGRKRLIRRHLAQRRFLYASAISQGDLRAALSVLRDEAELEGLYDHKLLEVEKRLAELERARGGEKPHCKEATPADRHGQPGPRANDG